MRSIPATMFLIIATLSEPAVPPSPLAGSWVNKDPASRSVTKLNVSDTAGRLQVRIWSRCYPTDCDNGVHPAELFTSDGRTNTSGLPSLLVRTPTTLFVIVPSDVNKIDIHVFLSYPKSDPRPSQYTRSALVRAQ